MASTVATAVVLLVHIPPDIVDVREVDDPAHTAAISERLPAAGSGFTVMVVLVNTVPQELVTP